MKWNNNFSTKTKVNGREIVVGAQNFEDNTILVKEDNGNIVSCPMGIDDLGDIFFVYDNASVWLKWL